jgi:topoisomerase-4 subunit B
LVASGNIYVSRPPLFRIDVEKRGKKPSKKIYALDDYELASIFEKLKKEGTPESQITISRFKGLGEMNAEQLWETTLNPDTRRLMPVKIDASEKLITNKKFNMLMAKRESSSRRLWLEKMSDKAQVDL